MTTLTLDEATIGAGLGAVVPALSLTVAPGAPTVIAVETDERPLLVSMLLGGRIKADSGHVLIDGRGDDDALRAAVALVDTPFVAEPPAEIPLALVIAEEFSFSSRPSSSRDVLDFLRRHGVAEYARLPVRSLPPVDRIRLLTELAVSRPQVSAIVLTSPERHGTDPARWYGLLEQVAERGIAVAIVTDEPTAALLLTLGATDAAALTSTPAQNGAS